MRTLYFNCQSGISGDMVVAALLDLGVDKNWLIGELAKLKLKNYRIEIKNTRFIVHTKKENKERNLGDIYKIINKSSLSQAVKSLSKKIFLNLAKTEAKVHKASINTVHFHEVGAIDSIIDIIAAAALISKLKPEKIYASVAIGTVVPPATKELLKGVPLNVLRINKELVTPTGAAIIKTVVNEFIDSHNIDIKIEKRGFGAGKRDLKIPNVLETVLGETEKTNEKLVILETNIDDMNPEFYQYIIEKLIKDGARDAYVQPLIMKKNRLGTLLTVVCHEKFREKLIEDIFDETTTFGIRVSRVLKVKLDRRVINVQTRYGTIRVKIGSYRGKIRTVSPEYEDCKRAAAENNVPLKKIYDEVKSKLKK